MDITGFWDLIEAARASAGPGKPFHQALTDLLAARTREEILQYQDRFDEMYLAVYRWDMWAAAYLIGDGCSDDSFMDFRAGLIAQGHDWYRRAAASPDSLAGHPAVVAAAGRPWDNPLFYEEAAYAASYAFEQDRRRARLLGRRGPAHQTRQRARGHGRGLRLRRRPGDAHPAAPALRPVPRREPRLSRTALSPHEQSRPSHGSERNRLLARQPQPAYST
jgi:hypothetical protein